MAVYTLAPIHEIPLRCSGISSVQFSLPRLTWCWELALQDHDTVISVIDAVVAGKEMASGVAGMRTEMVRRWHWMVACSMLELLQPGMRGRQVKTGVWQESRRRYWRPNTVAGENKSRTRAWSPLRSIQGRDHADTMMQSLNVTQYGMHC